MKSPHPACLLLMLLAMAFAACLSSCTIRPSIRSADGSIATLGGSLFTKSAGESSSYEGPLGKLTYSTATNDETVVPGKIINSQTMLGLGNMAYKSLKVTEGTKTTLGAQSVSKHATTTAADVEKLRIKTPVPEAPAAPVPTAPFNPETGLGPSP